MSYTATEFQRRVAELVRGSVIERGQFPVVVKQEGDSVGQIRVYGAERVFMGRFLNDVANLVDELDSLVKQSGGVGEDIATVKAQFGDNHNAPSTIGTVMVIGVFGAALEQVEAAFRGVSPDLVVGCEGLKEEDQFFGTGLPYENLQADERVGQLNFEEIKHAAAQRNLGG